MIAIIGGIGSGKSLIARQFAGFGCAVIDADELARKTLHESDVVERLKQWWGAEVIKPDGSPDRSAIARIVFNHPPELQRLEDLIHPRVHARRLALRQRFEADPAIIAIIEDCPLLLEKGIEKGVDAVVFVQASDENRRRRVAESRGWTAEEHARREKSQMGLDIKASRADYVIENNGGETESLAHVRQVLTQILQKQSGKDPEPIPEK
ncbi:MAG: dephospho-CoA kinase [Phycisphaeraceae bacterium]